MEQLSFAQTDIREKNLRQAKKILIVDDHPILRKGLGHMLALEEDLEVGGEASNFNEALEVLKTAQMNLVIVDITLEGADGLSLIKTIRLEHPSLPILVLSMHDEDLYAERALRVGANGYIMKERAAEDLLLAIRRVLDGHTYVSETISKKLESGSRVDSSEADLSKTLTDRELEVFRYIGLGLTNRQIAERLSLSKKTVDAFREKIKTKLKIESANKLVLFAFQSVQEENKKKP